MHTDSETGLSPAECRDLQVLSGIMIPPSDEYGVPGADDAKIQADIVATLGRDREPVRRALAALAAMNGGTFAALDQTTRQTAAETFLNGDGADVATLGRVVLQCYYRDDRVVRSLGLEPRPPFPKGYTLEQGDWSLLDPVRARPKMWRDAP